MLFFIFSKYNYFQSEEKKETSPVSSESEVSVEDGADRAAWGGQLEFILTCVG